MQQTAASRVEDIIQYMQDLGQQARSASAALRRVDSGSKNRALEAIVARVEAARPGKRAE